MAGADPHEEPKHVFLVFHEFSRWELAVIPRANPRAPGIPAPCAFSRFKAYLRVASSFQTEAGSKREFLQSNQLHSKNKRKIRKNKKEKERERKKPPFFPTGKK